MILGFFGPPQRSRASSWSYLGASEVVWIWAPTFLNEVGQFILPPPGSKDKALRCDVEMEWANLWDNLNREDRRQFSPFKYSIVLTFWSCKSKLSSSTGDKMYQSTSAAKMLSVTTITNCKSHGHLDPTRSSATGAMRWNLNGSQSECPWRNITRTRT